MLASPADPISAIGEVSVAERFDAADVEVAGVVHDDVDLAAGLHDGRDRTVRGFLRADVEVDDVEVQSSPLPYPMSSAACDALRPSGRACWPTVWWSSASRFAVRCPMSVAAPVMRIVDMGRVSVVGSATRRRRWRRWSAR